MKASRQTRFHNAAAALAVVFLHGVVIFALLSVSGLLNLTNKPTPASVTSWIFLPPTRPSAQPAQGYEYSAAPPTNPSTNFILPPSSYIEMPTPVLPVITPPATLDAPVLATLDEYFSCGTVDYDKMSDAERQLCALNLSHLGSIAALPFDYADQVGTPFDLFGARGTFTFTPAAAIPVTAATESTVGCVWAGNLCWWGMRQSVFGFVQSNSRASADARFALAKGLDLDIGAQMYMQNLLGGTRIGVTSGAVITYRW